MHGTDLDGQETANPFPAFHDDGTFSGIIHAFCLSHLRSGLRGMPGSPPSTGSGKHRQTRNEGESYEL